MIRVFKQPTVFLLSFWTLLFAFGLWAKCPIWLLVLTFFLYGSEAIVSYRHRNDLISLSEDGIETDFKSIQDNNTKRTFFTWDEISTTEILITRGSSSIYVYIQNDIFVKEISRIFPLGNVKKLKKAILEIGHVECKIIRM